MCYEVKRSDAIGRTDIHLLKELKSKNIGRFYMILWSNHRDLIEIVNVRVLRPTSEQNQRDEDSKTRVVGHQAR